MALDTLEKRLEDLERRVLGAAGSHAAAAVCVPEGGAAAALDSLAKSLGNAMEQRGDRVAPALRRTAELDRYLDPSFAEDCADAEAKADLVLSREAELREAAKLAQRLESLREVLDGNAFARVGGLEPRLRELERLQLGQMEQGAALSEETLELVGRYNEVVEELTKTFIHYDLVLKAAEERARGKKE